MCEQVKSTKLNVAKANLCSFLWNPGFKRKYKKEHLVSKKQVHHFTHI